MSKTVSIELPDKQDLSPMVEKVLQEMLSPVVRLEALKRKPYLSPKDVKELYGISEASLKTWRNRGGGPEYIQPYKNGQVLYTHEAIHDFQRGNRVRG